MGGLILMVAAAVVAAAGAFFAASLRVESPVGFALAVYTIGSGVVIVGVLGLSLAEWLTRAAVVAVSSGSLAVALVVWAKVGRPTPPPPAAALAAARSAFADPLLVFVAGVVGATYAYLTAAALSVPQSSPDTLVYHLPRVLLWIQQRAVGYVDGSPDERIDATPPNAEIETTFTVLLSGSDRYVAVVQVLAVAMTSLAIFGIARRLDLGRREALFGAIVFPAFPVVALQAPTALNDMVLVSLLAATTYFALGAKRSETALAGLGLALAVGTKLSAALALPAIALFLAVARPLHRTRLLLAGALGMLLGAPWYLVNLFATGALDGDLGAHFGQRPDTPLDGLARRSLWLVLDFAELSAGEGGGRMLEPPLLVAVVWASAAIALALALRARRRRHAARVTVVAGVVGLVVLPMAWTWVRVAETATRRTGALLGLVEDPPERVPDGLLESPMHSAYGVGFVVLLVATAALVAADVRRGRRSIAPLLALAAPVATLAVLSLALVYDPMRMRLIAPSVALASATFGVTFRSRPLAWTAALAVAVSLVVTTVYFAPRPGGLAFYDRGAERSARWFVQGDSGGWSADSEAFRFFEERLPSAATVAVAAGRDTYLYPLWNGSLRRTVRFVGADGTIPHAARWLVVAPGRELDATSSEAGRWRRVLRTASGWSVFSRSGGS